MLRQQLQVNGTHGEQRQSTCWPSLDMQLASGTCGGSHIFAIVMVEVITYGNDFSSIFKTLYRGGLSEDGAKQGHVRT